ncbi:MAG: DUF4242 domain-containing protein [Nitrososphaeraceae archaeon]|nr:DUF4242 domain-containing protein [Nitrososphaeraceae archaeon]
MPVYLDVHKLDDLHHRVKELINSPPDEFGVSHLNLFINIEADICYCLLEAPSKEAVQKHHAKINIKCDWITEVKQAK